MSGLESMHRRPQSVERPPEAVADFIQSAKDRLPAQPGRAIGSRSLRLCRSYGRNFWLQAKKCHLKSERNWGKFNLQETPKQYHNRDADSSRDDDRTRGMLDSRNYALTTDHVGFPAGMSARSARRVWGLWAGYKQKNLPRRLRLPFIWPGFTRPLAASPCLAILSLNLDRKVCLV